MAQNFLKTKKGDIDGTTHSNTLYDTALRHTYKAIVNGTTWSQCVNNLLEDAYGIGRKYATTRAEQIARDARQLVRKDWEADRQVLKESLYASYMDIFNEARVAKDRTSAINCLKELGKLGGAYEAEKVDINLEGNIEIDFN